MGTGDSWRFEWKLSFIGYVREPSVPRLSGQVVELLECRLALPHLHFSLPVSCGWGDVSTQLPAPATVPACYHVTAAIISPLQLYSKMHSSVLGYLSNLLENLSMFGLPYLRQLIGLIKS